MNIGGDKLSSITNDPNSLFYTPNIEPELSYDSDGTFIRPTQDQEESIEEKPNRLVEVTNDLASIINAADLLPSRVGTIIKDMIVPLYKASLSETIDSFTEDISKDDSVIEEDSDNEIIVEEVEDFTSTVTVGTELFEDPGALNIQVEENPSFLNLINSSYQEDNLQLKEEYISKMQQCLHKFFASVSTCILEGSIPEEHYLLEDYDGNAVTVPSEFKHLDDTIIKSQIIRKQKEDYFAKLHNAENTLIYVRNFNIANEQRKRYYSIDYKADDTYAGTQDNFILQQNRMESDKKYKAAMNNLYKYLNSSVEISDDILSMNISEANAKVILINNDIDVFAKSSKEYTDQYGNKINTDDTTNQEKEAAINNEEKKDALSVVQNVIGEK